MSTEQRENLAAWILYFAFGVMIFYVIALIAGAISGVALIGILAIQGNAICRGIVGFGVVIILITSLSKTTRDISGYR